jgi:hypothetical protein
MLITALRRLVDFDPQPLSPQTQALKAILERLEPQKPQPIPDTASTGSAYGDAVAAGAPAQADPRHRLEGATAVVRALSQARPHPQAGQHRTTAIARELTGFVWAIARQVTVTTG